MAFVLRNVDYITVHDDYEKRMALAEMNRQGLQWVSTSKAKSGYRMKFGRFVKPPEPTTRKKPYVGSKEWWNAEDND